MKKKILIVTSMLLLIGSISELPASTRDEINYLLHFGQKVLVEGTRRGERKWDFACRIKRKTNYVAIVQSDTANYRVVPVPGGQRVEKICPPDVFKNAIRWYNDLQKGRY